MENIQYLEKPIWISWDDIAECQQLSHAVNIAKGIDMLCAHFNGEDVKNNIGKGKCFVALDGDKVVGTVSYTYEKTTSYWCKGLAAYICFGAVLPDYSGRGIYLRLHEILMESVRNEIDKVDCIWMSTSEKNNRIQMFYKKQGFSYVQIKVSSNKNYYSVVMAKWLTEIRPNHLYVVLRYVINFLYIKLRYKPGHIKRFGC